MAGMMSQNVLNLVDIAMVGRLGPEQIAAVGVGGLCSFLACAYVIGFASAVQSMSARRFGEDQKDVTALPLNAGLVLAVAMGIPITVLIYALTPRFFPLLNPDPVVVNLGIPYFRARIIAGTVMGMNFSFSGFWNGTNRSKFYMTTLIAMNILNIFFNWIFIFGHLGVRAYGSTGAGIASTIAISCGTAVYFVMGFSRGRPNGFLRKRPDLETLRTLVSLALPTGIQHTFYAGGLMVVVWIIGLVGTMELAASQIISMLLLAGILPGIGLGMGATSLVSQALGRRDPDDAERWGWEVTGIAISTMLIIGMPMILIPERLLGLFSKAPEVIAAGRVPLELTGFILGVEAVMIVCSKALLGAGDNRRVMFTSILLQWGLYIPMAYIAGPVFGLGLTAIWIAQLIYKTIGGITFAVMWKRRKWDEIEI